MSENTSLLTARTETLSVRNDEMRKAYNKLKCEEQIVSYGGRRIAIKLSYQQILAVLGRTYFLSKRRVEFILGQTEPTMAPINAKPTSTATPA